jgi:hypothetical protein
VREPVAFFTKNVSAKAKDALRQAKAKVSRKFFIVETPEPIEKV